MNWDADPRCGNSARRCAPDRSVGRRCRRRWCERRFGEVRGRRRRRAVRPHVRARAAADRDRRPLRSERGGRDPGQAASRQGDRERDRRRPPSRARRLPLSAARARGRPRLAVDVRVVRRRAGVDLPAGEAVRHRERAEPAGVLAAAVRRRRQQPLGAELRAVPRRRLRHAEVGGSRDLRRRRGAVAARQRSADREEQHLDVARPLPARARRVVPQERPHEAAHGRVQLPPLSQRGDRPARARLPVAERRLSRTSTG